MPVKHGRYNYAALSALALGLMMDGAAMMLILFIYRQDVPLLVWLLGAAGCAAILWGATQPKPNQSATR